MRDALRMVRISSRDLAVLRLQPPACEPEKDCSKYEIQDTGALGNGSRHRASGEGEIIDREAVVCIRGQYGDATNIRGAPRDTQVVPDTAGGRRIDARKIRVVDILQE